MTTARLLVAVDESRVTPGVLGFVVVALLGVATYLLIRSMNRQIRRIDLPDDESGGGSDGPPGRAHGGPDGTGDGTGTVRPDDRPG